MSEAKLAPNNYRYERKFTIAGLDREIVLQEINKHAAFFSAIYHPRQINNIYLDTEQLNFYYDNIEGIAERKKVRIRWYGINQSSFQKPVLEYKLKQDLLGDKWSFPLPDFSINALQNANGLRSLFAKSNLPQAIAEDLKILRPTLLNSYHRSYYLSADKKFRLTFDEQMEFKTFHAGQPSVAQARADHFVVELKYDPQHDREANKISKLFSFRLDKSSKYVSGIELTR